MNQPVVPALYLSRALSDQWFLGLSVNVPFGLKTEYDSNWQGAAQSEKFEIKTLNINPSVAYRVNEMVSLGGGLNWQKLEADYVRQVGTADYPGAPFPGASSTATLKLHDTAWGWNIGALFNISPATKVGMSYRSTMKYSTTGYVTVSGPSANVNNAGTSGAKADIKLPDTFILSGTHKLDDRWQLLGDVSWTGWSSLPKVDIIRTSNTNLYIPGMAGSSAGTTAQTLNTDFRNTWRVAVGANYQLNADWKLKTGIAYDQTPVKGTDTRLVSLPDNDRTWFSLGAQWKPTKEATLDFGAAYLYIKNANIHNDQSASPSAPTAAAVALALASNRGTVDGTYKDSCWIFGLQYSQAF